MTENLASLEEIAQEIIGAGAVSIHNVDDGEDIFIYSTGNRGPGYVMIKGLVGQPEVLKFLTKNLALRVIDEAEFDFIEGNATGGMVPAWQLRNDVSDITGKQIPYCYLRGSRKEGGHGELITGDGNNPLIKKGMRALVVEELVNYAGTTGNAAEEFRAAGYPVSHAACILFYDQPQAKERLREKGVSLVSLITLPQLLNVAESASLIPKKAIDSYRSFLQDSLAWQLNRGLVIPADSAKKAIEQGYDMKELSSEESLILGAPAGKVKEGIVYWRKK